MVGFGKEPEQGGFGQIISRSEERKTDNGGGAKNCGSRASVRRCVPLSPGSESEKKSARCLTCAIRFWTESAWEKGRKCTGGSKKCFLPFFFFRYRHASVDLPQEETHKEKQALYPETP